MKTPNNKSIYTFTIIFLNTFYDPKSIIYAWGTVQREKVRYTKINKNKTYLYINYDTWEKNFTNKFSRKETINAIYKNIYAYIYNTQYLGVLLGKLVPTSLHCLCPYMDLPNYNYMDYI